MSELLEDMEHAAHANHHEPGPSKGIGKHVGITMAMLGVLMAVCSALVGMSRTQLIATMVEKSETANRSQAVATKYRLMQSQLQSTHAFLQTDPDGAKKREAALDELEKASATTPVAPALRVTRLEAAIMMDAVIPSSDDVIAMAKTTKRYMLERDAAEHWAESYGEKVEAWEQTGEHYEWAQLVAEIGVVVASIALLLQSRLAWSLSITLGLSSIGLIVFTYLTSHTQIHEADEVIATSRAAYDQTANEKIDDKNDQKLIDETLKVAAPAPTAAHAP
jgi:hypothetical protein